MNDAHITTMPKARVDRLIVKELPDETLVYDLDSDLAYCLNASAHAVWKRCDGVRSVGEISQSISGEIGAPVDESVVWLALDQLEKHKLLADAPKAEASFPRIARRHVMRTLGVSALALPMIVSIVVPTAQAQASPCALPVGRPNLCPCTISAQCLGGCCKNGSNVCDPSPAPSCH